VFNTCRRFIRRVSVLPRDDIDMDDVDSAEDHVGGRLSPTQSNKNRAPFLRDRGLGARFVVLGRI
jgi:hypothetical protein